MIQCFTSYANLLTPPPLTFLQCVCHCRLLGKCKTPSKESCFQVCNKKKKRLLRKAAKWKLSSLWGLLTAHLRVLHISSFWLNTCMPFFWKSALFQLEVRCCVKIEIVLIHLRLFQTKTVHFLSTSSKIKCLIHVFYRRKWDIYWIYFSMVLRESMWIIFKLCCFTKKNPPYWIQLSPEM